MQTESLHDHLKRDQELLQTLKRTIEQVIIGKPDVVDMALVALLCKGHILFEDVPGTGKTTLARAIAQSLGCSFNRIQFTSDMLPSDVLGISIFETDTHEFKFKPGPLFANIILADEINRTTPRTQSALLEAMNEGQVTLDHTTHKLPEPFIVMATQNSIEFHGTYPLPESQLDRFLLRLQIGYPPDDEELMIIKHAGYHDSVSELPSVMTRDEMVQIQKRIRLVHVEDSLVAYLLAIVKKTRASDRISLGVSPRGAIMLHQAAQARAYLQGRTFVIPDDVKTLVVPAFCHRVYVKNDFSQMGADRVQVTQILRDILEEVPVPG